MSRRSQSQGGDAAFVIVTILCATAWVHRDLLLPTAYIILGLFGGLLFLRLCWIHVIHHRPKELANIETMTGLEFELYVARLLKDNGFTNVALTEKYDLGVDIIAEKDGVRWGIQAKRYSGLVKANAVRQVVTGLQLYNCDRAMVITNSTYSTVAKRLAMGNNCVLIDGKDLRCWL